MPGTVRFELADHVATITYNRPEALNTVNGELEAHGARHGLIFVAGG